MYVRILRVMITITIAITIMTLVLGRVQEKNKVLEFMRTGLKVDVEEATLATRGWNWGDANVTHADGSLRFTIDNKLAFDIPLSDVAQSTSITSDSCLFACSID